MNNKINKPLINKIIVNFNQKYKQMRVCVCVCVFIPEVKIN